MIVERVWRVRQQVGRFHIGSRHYNPETGRFLTHDTIAFDPTPFAWGQNNRWTYCANDPVNWSDASGNSIEDEALGVIKFLLGNRVARGALRLLGTLAGLLELLTLGKDLCDPFFGGVSGYWDWLDSGLAWLALIGLAIGIVGAFFGIGGLFAAGMLGFGFGILGHVTSKLVSGIWDIGVGMWDWMFSFDLEAIRSQANWWCDDESGLRRFV